jgi:hypothetical protein
VLGQALLANHMSSQPRGILGKGPVKDPKSIEYVSSLSQACVLSMGTIERLVYHLLLRE